MAVSPTSAETEPSTPPLLIFDGDCGLCTALAARLRRFVDPDRLAIEPSHSVDLDALGLSADDVERCVWFAGDDGASHELFEAETAVGMALQRSANVAVRAAGIAIAAPTLRPLTGRIYRLVARNRHLLGSPSCGTG